MKTSNPARACFAFLMVGVGLHGCSQKPTTEGKRTDVAVRATNANAREWADSASLTGPSAAPSGASIGLLQEGPREILYVTYVANPISEADLRLVEKRVARATPGLPIVAVSRDEQPCVIVAALSGADVAQLDEQDLAFFGHGLGEQDKTLAATAKSAIFTAWRLDSDPGLERMKAALTATYDSAIQFHGVVWDETIRVAYSTVSLKAERIDTWDGAIPDLTRSVAQHYYENASSRHRDVTLGMGAFGLPDLVIEDLPPTFATLGSELVSAVAQLLVEGATPDAAGNLRVDLAAIKHAGVRRSYQPIRGAPITLRLVLGRRESGDAENRLLELQFDGFKAATEPERLSIALRTLFGEGREDAFFAPSDDAALEEIKKRVQAKLPTLAARFRKGLALGEYLSLKAPFATKSGNVEWMWMTVSSWPVGGDPVGQLDNEPFDIPDLHRGATVTVRVDLVADYILKGKAGATEGGESERLLERR
ncbi:MAG: DUF2314 domain-containing protein [Polyangiaceae bacterium]